MFYHTWWETGVNSCVPTTKGDAGRRGRGWEHKQEMDETALNVSRARQRPEKNQIKKTKKHQIFRHPHEVLKIAHDASERPADSSRLVRFPRGDGVSSLPYIFGDFFSNTRKKNPHQKKISKIMYRKAECFQTINMLNKFKPSRNKITPCTRLSPVKEKRQTIPRRHLCVGDSASGDQTRKGTEREKNKIKTKQKNPFSRAS